MSELAATATNSKTDEKVVLYAGVGPELVQYDINIAAATLVKRGCVVRLPASVQYAWQHVSKKYFYVVSSNGGPGAAGGPARNTHHLSAFRVDPISGALQPHGDPIPLRQRPIHMTTDIPSEHVLIAYCDPSGLSVHRIDRDGTVGSEVKQPASLDFGIWAHQIRVTPSNAAAILVTRGHNAARGKPEDPGALKIFKYHGGGLNGGVSVAPGGGYGFGPRHLDFHPTQPWVYVSLERQHKIHLYTLNGDALSREPIFVKDTLAEPDNVRPRQMAGTIRVHPNGRFVYGCERATSDVHGQRESAFQDGENTIVVYAIDQSTGEPDFIQRVDTRGMHPRTFSIDPGGRILVVANKSPVVIQEGGTSRTVPASLDVFRIGADGKLEYMRQYPVEVGDASMFWSGLLKL